jgi:hypothetical protein
MGSNGATIGSGAGAVIGAAIGSMIEPGIGTTIGGMVGSLAGGIIGSALFPIKLITDLQSSNSSYGNPLPILYGTARLSGTQIWQTQISQHTSGLFKGGILGSTVPQQSAAYAFCEGPAVLQKIWLDGILFVDLTQPVFRELSDHTFDIRINDGTEDQLPDFQISQWVRDNVVPGDASPAYRGVCYMVMEGVTLTNYAGRFPMVTAAWSNHYTETTVFKPLAELSPDPDPASLGTLGGYGSSHATAVDWSRNLFYFLAADGTIRAYDLIAARCVMAKTQAELAVGYPALAAVAFFSGLCCGLGTQLYLVGYVYAWPNVHNGAYLWTIDPNTLTVTHQVTLPFIAYSASGTLLCFAQPDLAATEMVAGQDLFGGGYVVNPATGQIGMTPNPAGAYEVWSNIVLGNQDLTSGLTDLWFVDSGLTFANPPPLTIGRVQLAGSDPSNVGTSYAVQATLYPADFGLTVTTGLIERQGCVAMYDTTDGSLILTNIAYIGYDHDQVTAKWSPTGGVIWTNYAGNLTQFHMPNTVLDNGKLGAGFNFIGGVPVIDLSTGVIVKSPIASADAARTPAVFGAIAYNCANNSMVYRDQSGQFYFAYLQLSSGSEIPVAEIITDVCSRVGITSDMIDVSKVTTTTYGYVVKDIKSAGVAIAELCNTYLIDMYESDYKLRFAPRGQPVVATITQADLGSIDNNDSSQYWQVKSAQELELPLQITVKYIDPNLDFQPGSAAAKRTTLPVPTQFSKRKLVKDLPVVATNAEARQVAENWLYTMWASRDTFETVLSPKYLWLDPTDNITVVLDNGDTTTVRIENIDTGADLSMRLSLAAEDLTVYAPTTSPGVTYGAKPQTLTPSTFAQLLQFNVPLLQDSDGAPVGQIRIYTAAGASVAGWRGGEIFRSTDAINWQDYAPAPSGANWGHALTALADTGAKFSTDYVNSVRVILISGSTLPSSCAYVDLMNGANAALLGQEIIQFQTVVDNADGSLTLSDIVRSRRGTDWATGTHRLGEMFILLQPGFIAGHALTLGEIGQSEGWKLVPFGTSVSQSASSNFKYLGYDLKPYAPINFERAPSGADLVLSWVRRTRIGGLLIDGIDTVPLNEEAEAYEAYVLPSGAALAAFDPTLPATYTRAFLGLTAPAVTYTASQMSADGFIPATSTLYLVVFQISGVVGRGFPGYQAVPAF